VIKSLKADCEAGRAGLWDNPSPGPGCVYSALVVGPAERR
jgi:hypothetical protein